MEQQRHNDELILAEIREVRRENILSREEFLQFKEKEFKEFKDEIKPMVEIYNTSKNLGKAILYLSAIFIALGAIYAFYKKIS